MSAQNCHNKGNDFTSLDRVASHIYNNRASFIITSPGDDYLTLAINAISSLLQGNLLAGRVIIIGAKRSIEQRWLPAFRRISNNGGLAFSAALGKRRNKLAAFESDKKIILTNDEELSWTMDTNINRGDILIIDELARFRYFKSARYHFVKAITDQVSKIIAFSRFPIPHGLAEIWEEMYLLDRGQRLGTYKASFIERYFFVNRIWTEGHTKKYLIPKEGASEAISRAIGDICLTIDDVGTIKKNRQQKKYIYIELNRTELSKYRMMAEEMQMQVNDEHSVKTANTSATASKLLQLASGTVYDNNKEVLRFHEKKIEALKQLLEELPNQNVLITYWFKHELMHLLEALPAAQEIRTHNDISDWNNGKIRIGLINSSMGGRCGDLEDGGNVIIWFSLTWSLNLYTRTNERISSHGRSSKIIHLIAKDTIDELVVESLKNNKDINAVLLEGIRRGQ